MQLQTLFQNRSTRRVLVAVTGLVVVYLAAILFQIGDGPVYVALNNLMPPLVGSTAAWLFWQSGRRQKAGLTRQVWMGMAAGYALWAAADGIWAVYQLILRQPAPYPSIADLLFLAAYAPLLLALRTRLVSLRVNPSRQQVNMIRVVSTGLVVLSLVLVIWPIVSEWQDNTILEDVLNIAYPLLDLGLAIIASMILILLNQGRYALSWQFILAGLLLMTVSDLTFSYATSNNLYVYETNLNGVTVLVDVTYSLAYIAAAVGIYLHTRIEQAKEGYRVRLEMAPLERFYAVLYTNRSHEIISASSNFGALINAESASQYQRSTLEAALGISNHTFQALVYSMQANGMLSNYPLVINTLDGQRRETFITASAEKDFEGTFVGANIVVRANLPVPKDQQTPQEKEMQGVLRYLLAQAGSLGRDASPALQAYFLEMIRLLASLLHQFGGDKFQEALFQQLRQTADEKHLGVMISQQVVTLPEDCDAKVLSQILRPLMVTARDYASSVVGEQVVQSEIDEMEQRLDASTRSDLDAYAMRKMVSA